MSLDVPTLAFGEGPADYLLPWPTSVTLDPSNEGQVKITLGGTYELAPPADAESSTWNLTWDMLTSEEARLLEAASRLQALSFMDPLGRMCQGQMGNVRSQVKQGALDDLGRLMYGGSCELHLFQSSHLPWCPDFARPVPVAGGVMAYGRVGPRDPLAPYGFIQSACPVSTDKRRLVCEGGPTTNWGALEAPDENWDRTARDGLGSDPLPTTRLSTLHLSPRRGSFFFAFTTTGA